MANQKKRGGRTRTSGRRLIALVEKRTKDHVRIFSALLPMSLKGDLELPELRGKIEELRASATKTARKLIAQGYPQAGGALLEDGERILTQLRQAQLQMSVADMLEQLVIKAAEMQSQVEGVLQEFRVAIMRCHCMRLEYEMSPTSNPIAKLRAHVKLRECEAEYERASQNCQRTMDRAEALFHLACSVMQEGDRA